MDRFGGVYLCSFMMNDTTNDAPKGTPQKDKLNTIPFIAFEYGEGAIGF
ncbi:MAG: hypothetical protein K5683_08565 [Prevotella sp.]|nr:hypothetical protein [Prevotella sp.]